MPETFFTPEEVADSLKVSRYTVWKWIRDGMLTARKLPSGEYRIAQASFDEFLNNGESRASRRGRRPNAR